MSPSAINRRRFLTAAAATALAPAQAKLRIAFWGVAHSHAQDKINLAKNSPDWELAGFCEDDPKLQAEYEKAGFRALVRDEMLGDTSLQVIAIESAVKPHASMARIALAAGKHVHLEKPPAENLSDLRTLVELARRKRLLLQMGYMWRHHPGINAALEAARKGWLGEVYLVRGTMNTLIGADRRPEWALFRGGQMFEQGSHLIDPMIRLLGKPQKITPYLRHHGSFSDNLADNTVAMFEYPRAMGIIMSSVLQPGATAHRAFEIFGANGNAVVRPIEQTPTLQIDLAKPAGPYKAGSQTFQYPQFRRYTGDFEELADAIRRGRMLSVSFEEDLLVQEALLRASEMPV